MSAEEEAILEEIVAKAESDAEQYVGYLREVQPEGELTPDVREEIMKWSYRTLASIWHAAGREEADSSPELEGLALRLALDPRKAVESPDLFKCTRQSGGWAIREYPNRITPLLPDSAVPPVRYTTTPLVVGVLDCVMGERRKLPELRKLVADALGGVPAPEDCLPETEVEKPCTEVPDLLFGSANILKAIKQPTNENSWRAMKALSEKTGGPIISPGPGQTPFVKKEALLIWLNGLVREYEIRKELREAKKADYDATRDAIRDGVKRGAGDFAASDFGMTLKDTRRTRMRKPKKCESCGIAIHTGRLCSDCEKKGSR